MENITQTLIKVKNALISVNGNKDSFEYDGQEDNRIFLSGEYSITVSASQLGKDLYNQMEEQLNSNFIDREHYTVYGWNDISGFDYWNKEDEYNYIMITISFKDSFSLDLVSIDQLYEDAVICYLYFEQYDIY